MPGIRRIRRPFTDALLLLPILDARVQVMLVGGGGSDFWADGRPSLDATTVVADKPHLLSYFALKLGGALEFEDASLFIDDSDIFAAMPDNSVAIVTPRLTGSPAIYVENDIDNLAEVNVFEVEARYGAVLRGWHCDVANFESYEDRASSRQGASEEIIIANVVPAQVDVLSAADRTSMGRRIGIGDEGPE